MITQHKTAITELSFLFLSAVVGVVFAFYTSYKLTDHRVVLPIAKGAENMTITPIPTLAPRAETTTQISPDGTKELTMTTTTNPNLSKTYVFTSSDADGTSPHTIYSATYSTVDSMSIPFDTWSPDDKLVFLNQNTASGSAALVLKANGDPITATASSINETAAFTAKNTSNNIYDQTTGWASETLLVILTKTPEGKEGTSYWFEVPTQAVIPLSTHF